MVVQKILDKILGLKRDESFLVVADPPNKKHAYEIYKKAKMITKDARFLLIDENEEHGQEPGKEAADLMQEYDVQFYWTKKSLSHTKARRDATSKGKRIVSAPGLSEDILNRCVDIDYDRLKDIHKKIFPLISRSGTIHITSKKGTDIMLSVHDTRGDPEHLLMDRPKRWGNIPIGEVDSGIVRDKTDGMIVFDGSFPGIGLIDEPIIVQVKKGTATIISDNPQSRELKRMLDKHGKDAFRLAELGIGTNPEAKVTGNLLEDEKVLGTVHFALGNDISYNGDNDVAIHLDGVVVCPTVKVDGRMLIKDGDLI